MTVLTDKPMIFEKLAAVMADVQAVAKNDRNQHQNFQFRGIDAVMNAVGPALRAHKVLVVPDVDSATYTQTTTSKGNAQTCCRVQVTYTFYTVDGSGLPVNVVGEAWDSGDKATSKAMSVAFRTALLQALCLPTDEPDPDHDTYQVAPEPQMSSEEIAGLQATLAEWADQIDKGDELVEWAGDNPTRLQNAIARAQELAA